MHNADKQCNTNLFKWSEIIILYSLHVNVNICEIRESFAILTSSLECCPFWIKDKEQKNIYYRCKHSDCINSSPSSHAKNAKKKNFAGAKE